MAASEEELEQLREANASLRQALDEFGHLHQIAMQMGSAQSIEQLFRILSADIPAFLPAIAVEGIFFRPASQTIFQFRHLWDKNSPLPMITEEALGWARERGCQTFIPSASGGGVLFCPLLFQEQDLGHLLVYTGALESYSEVASQALKILGGQAAVSVSGLWKQARLEDELTQKKNERQLLEDIQEALPNLLVALDASGHILYANHTASLVLGRNLSTLATQHYQMVLPAEFAEAVSESYLALRKGKTGHSMLVRFKSFHGETQEQALTATRLNQHGRPGAGLLLIGKPL